MAFAIGALLVLCATFVGLSSFQGPKLAEAHVDTERVLAGPDQQLRLFANQAVAQVDEGQVSISPPAPFTVSTQDEVIAVQFSERLDYGTDYTVTVAGVRSAYQDRASEFEYSFRTDEATFHYLDRADPATEGERPDAVYRTGVTGSERELVYEAARIQDFVVFDGVLVVSTLNDDDTSALTLVSLVDGATEPLDLPAPGTVEQLTAAPGASVLGFTLTSPPGDPAPQFVQTLFAMDLEGDRVARPVPGLDGAPIEVADWMFLPGGATAVVRSVDESVLRIDLAALSPATPLGTYLDLASVSPDGSRIVVDDIFGSLALSLADGTEERLPAAPLDGVAPAAGDIRLLGEDLERVQQVAVLDDATGRFASYLVHDDGESARVLYESPDGKGSIDAFRVSPNGQYVAVTVTPDVSTSVSDGYFVSATATSVSTIIIEIASGAVLRSVDGFAVSW